MTDVHVPEVVVVGSANLDVAVEIERFPVPGETLLGGDVHEGPGGKGLNQAVAAARLGRRTSFVGSVGDDSAGRLLGSVLDDAGVQSRVVRASGIPSGRALVLTEVQGESTIVVSPGANATLNTDMVARSRDLLEQASAVLVQLEIPAEAVAAAARFARGMYVLNPAPGRPVAAEVLDRVDVLVPNRYELGVLAGGATPDNVDDTVAAVDRLGVDAVVVVTLGSSGAVVVERGLCTVVPAAPVDAVDSTGAGDTFCAALVDAMLDGAEPVEAARWAAQVAAITVGRRGASESFPAREEVRTVGGPSGRQGCARS